MSNTFDLASLEFRNALQNTVELQQNDAQFKLIDGICRDENSMMHSFLQSVDPEYYKLWLQKEHSQSILVNKSHKQLNSAQLLYMNEKEILATKVFSDMTEVHHFEVTKELLCEYAHLFRKLLFKDLIFENFIAFNRVYSKNNAELVSPVDIPSRQIANENYSFSRMDLMFLPALAIYWNCNVLVLHENQITHKLEIPKFIAINYQSQLPTTLLYHSVEYDVMFRVGDSTLESFHKAQFTPSTTVLDKFVESEVRRRVAMYEEGEQVSGIGNVTTPSLTIKNDFNTTNLCHPALSISKQPIQIDGIDFFGFSCVDQQSGIFQRLFNRNQKNQYHKEDESYRNQKYTEIQSMVAHFGQHAQERLKSLEKKEQEFIPPSRSTRHHQRRPQTQQTENLPVIAHKIPESKLKINLNNNQMSEHRRRRRSLSSERKRRFPKGEDQLVLLLSNDTEWFVNINSGKLEDSRMEFYINENNTALNWQSIQEYCTREPYCHTKIENGQLLLVDPDGYPIVFRHSGYVTLYGELLNPTDSNAKVFFYSNEGNWISYLNDNLDLFIAQNNNIAYFFDKDGNQYDIAEIKKYVDVYERSLAESQDVVLPEQSANDMEIDDELNRLQQQILNQKTSLHTNNRDLNQQQAQLQQINEMIQQGKTISASDKNQIMMLQQLVLKQQEQHEIEKRQLHMLLEQQEKLIQKTRDETRQDILNMNQKQNNDLAMQRQLEEQKRHERIGMEQEIQARMEKDRRERDEQERNVRLQKEQARREMEEEMHRKQKEKDDQLRAQKLEKEQIERETIARIEEQQRQLKELERTRKIEQEAERQRILEEERERLKEEDKRQQEYEAKIQKAVEKAERERKELERKHKEEADALERQIKQKAEQMIQQQRAAERQAAEELARKQQRDNEIKQQFMSEIENEKKKLREQAKQEEQRLKDIRKSRKLASKFIAKDRKPKKSLIQRMTKKLFGSKSSEESNEYYNMIDSSSSTKFGNSSSDGVTMMQPINTTKLNTLANMKSRRKTVR